MFAIELARRAAAADSPLLSLAAHPGYAATNLQFAGSRHRLGALVSGGDEQPVIAQTAEMGALPALYAATMPGIPGGAFVGPDGMSELRGHPRIITGAGRAYDEAAGRRLWAESRAPHRRRLRV